MTSRVCSKERRSPPSQWLSRLEGGDNFLSISQRHSSPSSPEDPTGALAVLGTCPLGRFCEKEGQSGRLSALAAGFPVYSPPPQLPARPCCQLFRCGREGRSVRSVPGCYLGGQNREGGEGAVGCLGLGSLTDSRGIRQSIRLL